MRPLWGPFHSRQGTIGARPRLPRWFEECDPTDPLAPRMERGGVIPHWLDLGEGLFPSKVYSGAKVLSRSQPTLSGDLAVLTGSR